MHMSNSDICVCVCVCVDSYCHVSRTWTSKILMQSTARSTIGDERVAVLRVYGILAPKEPSPPQPICPRPPTHPTPPPEQGCTCGHSLALPVRNCASLINTHTDMLERVRAMHGVDR